MPVRFNEDLRLGCALQLTRAQLRAFCNARALHPLLEYDVNLRLGIWGGAPRSRGADVSS